MPDRSPETPGRHLRFFAAKVFPPLLLCLFLSLVSGTIRSAIAFAVAVLLAWFLLYFLARLWRRSGWPIRTLIGGAVGAGAVFLGSGIYHQVRAEKFARELEENGVETAAVEGALFNAHIGRVFFRRGAPDAEIDRF